MRRIVAVLLCVLILGSAAFAEEAGVLSYDFDLQFRLNAAGFPFRARQRAAGYAELLEMLAFRGNLSWCPDTDCMDLRMEIIPRTNPKSAVSFRIYGTDSVRRVTSPLFGQEAACYYPDELMRSALMIRDTFSIPLPSLFLLDPEITVSAYSFFTDAWNVYAGSLPRGGKVPYSTLNIISNYWKGQLETNAALNNWISAVVGPLKDGGATVAALEALPDLLLAAAGGKGLTVTVDGDTRRCTNADGFVLEEETHSEALEEFILQVPEGLTDYTPSMRTRLERDGGKITWAADLHWAREEGAAAEEDEAQPASRFGLHIRAEGLPETLPAESAFTGELSQDGYIAPAFSLLLQGNTGADGRISLALTSAERQEAGALFSCEGTVTPAVREEPMAFSDEELRSDYNLFVLSYSSQRGFIDKVKRPFLFGMIDFLYELPTAACQSIMDDLEESGVLKTALND